MKKALLIVAALVVAGIVIFMLSGNPLGRLVKIAIEEFGPKMTQAEVSVSNVVISASDGEGSISGLKLGNPKGFKTAYALKADKIALSLEPSSLTKDVILIHKIELVGPSIIYEKSGSITNFDAIQRNVEQYLGTSSKEKDSGDSKKMIIESLSISNAKVNYNGLMDIDLPNIELRNLGKKSGGVDSSGLAKAIISALNEQMMRSIAKAVTGSVSKAADDAKNAVKDLIGR
ncbi:MAG: hypothetical protein LBE24_07005 [Methylobacillus sp.]|jgi:hypothetical protein|nr:hypothetical protein [Methylobacillus sp.]